MPFHGSILTQFHKTVGTVGSNCRLLLYSHFCNLLQKRSLTAFSTQNQYVMNRTRLNNFKINVKNIHWPFFFRHKIIISRNILMVRIQYCKSFMPPPISLCFHSKEPVYLIIFLSDSCSYCLSFFSGHWLHITNNTEPILNCILVTENRTKESAECPSFHSALASSDCVEK